MASDSAVSAAQIRSTLNWSHAVLTPPGCHVDYDISAQCTVETVTTWFALAASDRLVVQSYVSSDETTSNSPRTVLLASSSFARYAMLYSLSPETVSFAPRCAAGKGSYPPDEVARVSRLAQGNWVCTGGAIY